MSVVGYKRWLLRNDVPCWRGSGFWLDEAGITWSQGVYTYCFRQQLVMPRTRVRETVQLL